MAEGTSLELETAHHQLDLRHEQLVKEQAATEAARKEGGASSPMPPGTTLLFWDEVPSAVSRVTAGQTRFCPVQAPSHMPDPPNIAGSR